MSEPKVYTWRDADAPVLDGSVGALIQVLRKCLVDGYGSGEEERTPPGAGWEMDLHSSTNKVAFRSLSQQASGAWFYIDDTGDFDGESNNGFGSNVAALIGCSEFDGWDGSDDPILTDVFGANGDIVANYIQKSEDETTERGWIIVADDQTVYLNIIAHRGPASEAWNIENNMDVLQRGFRMSMFGDYRYVQQAAGEMTTGAIVCGDNSASLTSRPPGVFLGTNNATHGASLDSILGGVDGHVVFQPPDKPEFASFNMPGISNFYSPSWAGPLPFRPHRVAESNATLWKGRCRGLWVPDAGPSESDAEFRDFFPDATKAYGEHDFGAEIGPAFYLATNAESNGSSHIALFSLNDWTEGEA